MNSKILVVAVFALLSVGCGPHKVLEAEERLALFNHYQPDPPPEGYQIICPEPSPDAMALVAASLSAEAQKAAFSGAYSESGGSIGVRTHTIQLIRDQLFSACQAYANHGISPLTYQMYLTRNQRNTIAMMAIEQLTGVIKNPSLTVSSNANSNTSGRIKALAAKAADLQKKIDAIPDKNSSEALALKKELSDVQTEQSGLKAVDAGAGGVVVSVPGGGGQLMSDAAVKEVTTAVQAMASWVINTDDSIYMCLDIFSTLERANRATDEVRGVCRTILNDWAKRSDLKSAGSDGPGNSDRQLMRTVPFSLPGGNL
jgi:hypothetical protein